MRFLIIVTLLTLNGCSPALFSQIQPTGQVLASATAITHPADARATTIAREIPSPLLSTGPESLIQTQTPTELNRLNATATPQENINLATPLRSRTPILTSDLLYIAPGTNDRSALMRWDHVTGYSSLLADNVTEFSISANGKNILILRPSHVSANGQSLYDLHLLNYETLQTSELVEQIHYPYHLEISPDGNWFVYQEKAEGGSISARRTDFPNHLEELGNCVSGNSTTPTGDLICSQLSWSPDSRQVVWSDINGLWLSSLQQPTPELIHKPMVSVSDPKDNITEIPVILHNISWSPVGRFVTVQVTPSLEGVHWHAVVDTRLGHLEEIPESSDLTTDFVSIHWTLTGCLIVAHGGNGNLPLIKIWNVFPTNPDLMVLNRIYELNTSHLARLSTPSDTATPDLREAARLDWFYELDEKTILLGLTFPSNLNQDGESQTIPMLLSLNLINGQIQKLVGLPFDITETLWAPDASGALLLGSNSQYFFFSLTSNNPQLVDLRSVIISGAHNFIWLPPAQRR